MAAAGKPPLTSLTCALCGARLRVGRYVFSRFTRNHYCIEFDACKARAKRRKNA